MPLSTREFTKRLLASQAIDLEKLKTFLDGIPANEMPKDGEELARRLVQQSMLTPYQAQVIYQNEKARLALGNYVILDKIGKGGMGMVLKALHRRMERVVALKVLSPSITKTAQAIERFQREVRAAAKLNHPNIVAAYDADQDGKTFFFVMQYVDGRDLSTIVKKQGTLEVEAAVDCVLQTARGLRYAHDQGIVHRDIKPHNLLLDSSGEVKILDMGLALVDSGDAPQAELTNTGVVMGTVDYMAPEQAVNSHAADARSDIYSLGITLWYLLVGKAAYQGDSLMAKLLAHRDHPIPSLRAARPDVSESLDLVFQRMVAKLPGHRYQTMEEVEVALQHVLKPGAVPVHAIPMHSEETPLSDFFATLEQESVSGSSVVDRHVRRKRGRSDSRLSGTIELSDPMSDTDSDARVSHSGLGSTIGASKSVWSKNWQLIVSLAGASAVVLLSLVLVWFATARGDVTVKSSDPSVRVAIKRNGEVVDEYVVGERRGGAPYRPGDFQVLILEGREELFDVENSEFRLGRNQRVIVRILPAGSSSAEE